jgi:4-hydroxybenzoate polyprenyltransferase
LRAVLSGDARRRLDAGALVRALRPRQYVKNGLVLTALIFSVRTAWRPLDPGSWLPLLLHTALAFVAFCALSSSMYLYNDLRDRDADRQHPRKRLRPIAAGSVTTAQALTTAILLALLALLLAIPLGWRFLLAEIAYLALTAAYSCRLKHVVLIDILIIAVGFVLRAAAGAFAIGVPVSPWLYICTLLGALFLAVNKRRQELGLLGGQAGAHRLVLDDYTVELIDQLASTVTASTIISYALYTFTAPNLPGNHVMMATIPFVIYGLFRYQLLVMSQGQGGSPDELIVKDKPLLICIVVWLLSSLILLSIYR